jgi:hypothetical protein
MQENAAKAAQGDYLALEERGKQINQKATQEALSLKRQALLERGRLSAAQAETGFVGKSPLREMYNMRLKEREALGTLQANTAGALAQNSLDAAKVSTVAQSRYNEAASMRVSSLTAGLQIAGSGLEGGASGVQFGQAITRPKKGSR